MNWVYWNTFWSLVGSLIWFMTIVTHPDSVVVDRHPLKPDERQSSGSKRPSPMATPSRCDISHGGCPIIVVIRPHASG
jgi:hypothetical protein